MSFFHVGLSFFHVGVSFFHVGVSFFHVGVPKFLILHPFFRFFARLFLQRGIDFAALRHNILSAWHFNAL